MKPNKQWKDVTGYEEYYLVNNNGDVVSSRTNKLRKNQVTTKSGYLGLVLYKKGARENKRIHRLVAEAFLPNPTKLNEVNHKNGIKTDNTIENLEWCTRKYNCQHAIRTGLRTIFAKPMKGKFGIEHPNSVKINQFSLDGTFIKKWDSLSDAARKYGLDRSHISKVAKGKQHTCGGFVWHYLSQS